MLLVSACLLGVRCRANGRDNFDYEVARLARKWRFYPICPEIFAGMGTPRSPAEIQSGDGFDVLDYRAKVIGADEVDYSRFFLAGAEEVYRLACLFGTYGAVLRDNSPSCGVRQLYASKFQGGFRPGYGVTAALLSRKGFRLWRQSELPTEAELNLIREVENGETKEAY